MHKRNFVAVASWIGLAVGLWIIAWIIAEAIPVFSDLLTLIVCTILILLIETILMSVTDGAVWQLVHFHLYWHVWATHVLG